MTVTSRARLLLDRISVYGPMVEVACSVLSERPIATEELRSLMCPGQEEDTAAELMPFLLDSGLVERARGRLRLASAYNQRWSAQINLLALLHGRADVNYAFRFIWEELLDRAEWAGTFLDRDSVWPVINQVPVPGASLPHLNANRMASWMRLASWIGLIQPERSNSFVLLPTAELLLSLLNATLTVDDESSMIDWVSSVESQFCRVTTNPGTLHPGFSSALSILAARGCLEFTTYSDEHLYQIGPSRVTHITLRKGIAA